ncbi:MAG: hypothetical protein JJU41_05895 [Bacteroidetes bacterium]|nr:hypothetical protein [Bacteroidota bacterium]MCH8523069.1 hypothetical protein [Balneolales bacterium]
MVFNPADDATEWLERLQKAENTDSGKYLLSNPGDVIVAEQLNCYPKAVKKFPSMHVSGMAYTRLALEQSSGEIAAQYKASLIEGRVLLDLTGGLGMDSMAFSSAFDTVHYVENARQPYLLACHNHRIGGAQNIQHHLMSAEEALTTMPEVDWIYIDPSRRNPSQRVFLLKDCEPDIVNLWNKIRQKSTGVMVKLSPMFDIHAVERDLPGVTNIHVVSVDGEVKEVLAIVSPMESSEAGCNSDIHSEAEVIAVCLPGGFSIKQEAARLPTISTENLTSGDTFFQDMALFVPDPAIIKARATDALGYQLGLMRLNLATDYLVGRPVANPAAKCYPVSDMYLYKPKELRRALKGTKVHIHQRGFPLSTDELYKRLGLKMGEDAHLFFTSIVEQGKPSLIVLKTSAALHIEM